MNKSNNRSRGDAPALRSYRRTLWPWVAAIVILLILPHVFAANSTITIMNQMAITIVFALSYNMLLGQAGMLSFGHAIYLGFGGFMCIHVMNYLQSTGVPIPLPFLPLFAGLFSMAMAMLIGSFRPADQVPCLR